MSDRTPWWYSGEDEPEPRPDEPLVDAPEAEDSGTSMDWGALLSGAARMVDWATSSVMAPHAEHRDPADHPQCVVCRTILLVGDPTSLLARVPSDLADPESLVDPDEAPPAPQIRWIPIVDRSPESRD
jgi:hypothetical protein